MKFTSSRLTLLHLLICLLVGVILPLQAQQLLDPRTQVKFTNPLPIPAAIDATQGGTFEMEITQFEQDLGLRDISGQPLLTKVWGYNGQYPGPTFVAKKDVPVDVFWYNNLTVEGSATGTPLPHLLPIDRSIHWALEHVEGREQYGIPIVTHLHGGHSESESDGLPEAWFTPGFSLKGKDFKKGDSEPYHYDNDQEAATLWYHDHTLGITRLNVYAGLAGFYILTDDHEQQLKATNKIPADPYDIGLAIQDRMFTTDGQLHYPSGLDNHDESGEEGASVLPEFFGNIILVNGKAWPVLEVEPRQYRFRMLNGSDSRFYNLFMSVPLSFVQIGTDNGLLPAPVAHNQLLISPGERKDVVIDFSNPALWGKTIILRNNAQSPFPKGTPPNPNAEGQIMAFRVSKPLNTAYPLTSVPGNLRASAMFDHDTPAKTRKLILFEGTDEFGRLKAMLGTFEHGALGFVEPITENPNLNATEVWEIYNTTPDAHPIHLHLVTFQVLNSQKFKVDFDDEEKGTVSKVRLIGQPKAPEPGQNGRKDTYPIAPGEVTRLIAKFDREGLYAWHCHILSHEDHEMMRPYYVGNMPDHMLASHTQDKNDKIPAKEKILNNGVFSIYPNPFSSAATLQIKLSEPAAVAVRLLDIRGRLVREVPVKQLATGNHQLEINSTDMQTGMYICEVEMNNKLYRSRVVLTR
ncbi:multicopper oxidase domain-containing protein [Pontibacter sp. KCTC 32443]|uniref:multicopper oxidase domain-containing protein n=1 Tax=Pontibacter TaxID=323449 RepID=UPI00164D5690|nr:MULTISPECIES: multicopper oxidase domain-containing protein [Pontibacter]MBC5772476.1 multicopper oxidase domain-containing protein [Pontibacter sp. KCTC 32443]